MGSTVSKAVKNRGDLAGTIAKSFNRDPDWVEYHAETLAEDVASEPADPDRFNQAADERKAFDLWYDGYHQKAITRIEKLLGGEKALDIQTKGRLQQFAARIASQWGQQERAEDLQREAFASNRNLLRPTVPPPYRALPTPGAQATAIAAAISAYRMRRGFLQRFEAVVAHLHAQASANQFEQALADLGDMMGLVTERHDDTGEGPDVLWLLPGSAAWIIEAKSRKNGKNALTKEEHGQLLVAEEWFEEHYPGTKAHRVSVHAKNVATKAAAATASYALTFEKLAALVSDARVLISKLCESQLSANDLVAECTRQLASSPIEARKLTASYLQGFMEDLRAADHCRRPWKSMRWWPWTRSRN